MKYISEKVGRGGSVLGIDRKPPGIELPPNARFVQADVFELTAEDILGISETGGFDVVVSDLAPRTTGVRHADQEESWRLFERAVILAGGMLEPGGRFTGKLLFSSRHGQAVDMLRSGYESVRTIHPKATRKESKEVFIVAKNRLG
jgi:23S rRNA (uridine2552-2'-O)-methyltransferase